MREIFHYIFRKKLHALPCLYVILAKNTELSFKLALATFNLQNPTGILLIGRGSFIFQKRTTLQKSNKSIYQKAPLVATEYFMSLRTRFVAAPP